MYTQKKWFYLNKRVGAKLNSVVADGVYFYKLIIGDASSRELGISTSFSETKKMILIK